MAEVEIQIPPRPEYVGVVRLALGSLARTAGMDEESIDDLRIVLSEACTSAVMAHEEEGSDLPVTVTWDVDADRVAIEISGVSLGGEDSGDVDTQGFSTRPAMAQALMKSLVDDYELSEEGARIRLCMDLEGRRA